MSNMHNSDDRKPKSVVRVKFDFSKVNNPKHSNRFDGKISAIIDGGLNNLQVGEEVCAKNVGANIINEVLEPRSILVFECEIIENDYEREPIWYACRVVSLVSKEIVEPTIASSDFVRKLDAIIARTALEETTSKRLIWLDKIDKEDWDPSNPEHVRKIDSIHESLVGANKERGTLLLDRWLNAHLAEIATMLKAEFAKPEPQPEPEPTPLPLLDEPSGAMAAAFEKVGLGNGNGNGHSLEAALAEAKAMDAESHGTDAAIVKKPTAARKKASSKK